jgi:23S rRNA pseudouridine2605 synthase
LSGNLSASPVLGAYCQSKEYFVLVVRRPEEKQLSARRNGVVMEDGYRTKPAKMRVSGTIEKALGCRSHEQKGKNGKFVKWVV